MGAASLLIIGAFRPLAIWCEFHLTQGGAGISDFGSVLPDSGTLASGNMVPPAGTFGGKPPVEHPGTEKRDTQRHQSEGVSLRRMMDLFLDKGVADYVRSFPWNWSQDGNLCVSLSKFLPEHLANLGSLCALFFLLFDQRIGLK